MGTYLNPNNESFLKLVNSGKYVDKTGLIKLRYLVNTKFSQV